MQNPNYLQPFAWLWKFRACFRARMWQGHCASHSHELLLCYHSCDIARGSKQHGAFQEKIPWRLWRQELGRTFFEQAEQIKGDILAATWPHWKTCLGFLGSQSTCGRNCGQAHQACDSDHWVTPVCTKTTRGHETMVPWRGGPSRKKMGWPWELEVFRSLLLDVFSILQLPWIPGMSDTLPSLKCKVCDAQNWCSLHWQQHCNERWCHGVHLVHC